jgi:hypothetical protein
VRASRSRRIPPEALPSYPFTPQRQGIRAAGASPPEALPFYPFTGSVRLNVFPRAERFSTQILPPIRSVSCRAR